MRRFIIHPYPQYPCDYPHESFVEDYHELVRRNPGEQDLNIFLNSHSVEFLRTMISKVPVLLDIFLRMSTPAGGGIKHVCSRAIIKHLDDLRETKRLTLAVNNAKNRA